MNYAEVVKTLNANKGGSFWADIAKLAGMDYSTVARVARQDPKTGGMPNPSVHTIEAISTAIEKLQPARLANGA